MRAESIDIFCHWAPKAFGEAALRASVRPLRMLERALAMPIMSDLGTRLQLMDAFPGYRQVPCLVSPPLEVIAGPNATPDLAELANDGMAEMCRAHPTRFPAFVASLPINNPDAAMREARRAVTDLGAAGVQLFTNVGGKPVDAPEVFQLFGLLAELDRPVWLHPARGPQPPDYTGEAYSRYEAWWALGWPYETSMAMYRLVFAGLFDRWPDAKVITHHGGGLIPMVEGRLGPGMEQYGDRTPEEWRERESTPLQGSPLPHFRRFFTDTATFGSAAAMSCALQFFGPERMLFATDMPFGPEEGRWHIRASLEAVGTLPLSRPQLEGLLAGNAARLLKPPLRQREASELCPETTTPTGKETTK